MAMAGIAADLKMELNAEVPVTVRLQMEQYLRMKIQVEAQMDTITISKHGRIWQLPSTHVRPPKSLLSP
jgi:hypothetical protein